ncbi:MAG: DUF4469 domain-containing protein [Bacteroidales bacterium]|nr:DUF4469 domain-containing protein [Bacteroidales bacterium]
MAKKITWKVWLRLNLLTRDDRDDYVAEDGRVIPLGYPVTENNPKKIICRVPDALTVGQSYAMKIVTRFTSGNSPLHDPRTIIFDKPVAAA